MSEWWTYSLRDFLLFSPRTYHRLIELYNAEIWPAQIVAALAAIAILIAVARGVMPAVVHAVLAVAWAWVAWAWLWNRYATINWAATYMSAAFAVEAALLLGVAVRIGDAQSGFRSSGAARAAGLGMLVVAVAYPLIAPLSGRGGYAAEVFGLMPEPTVLATLGVLLGGPSRERWPLLPIPLAWCLVAGATLWPMRAPEALLLPVVGAVALGVAVLRGPRRGVR